jgi:hypothetical protein
MPRGARALEERHRPAVQLQMGSGIILKKPDDEFGPVGAAIGLESGLGGRARAVGGSPRRQYPPKIARFWRFMLRPLDRIQYRRDGSPPTPALTARRKSC